MDLIHRRDRSAGANDAIDVSQIDAVFVLATSPAGTISAQQQQRIQAVAGQRPHLVIPEAIFH
jgi:hypothetical protein